MGRSAGQKAGLTVDDVVGGAVAIVDEGGVDALTMAAVAERLGVRSPSLYAHVKGLDDLLRRVALEAARRMAEALAGPEPSDASGLDALRRIMSDYRDFATAHPGLYKASQRATSPEADAELYAAFAEAAAPAMQAVVEAGVPENERVHVVRAVRSALHGFITLERAGGFGVPVPVDQSFDRLVDLVLRGVAAAASERRDFEHGGD